MMEVMARKLRNGGDVTKTGALQSLANRVRAGGVVGLVGVCRSEVGKGHGDKCPRLSRQVDERNKRRLRRREQASCWEC